MLPKRDRELNIHQLEDDTSTATLRHSKDDTENKPANGLWGKMEKWILEQKQKREFGL